MSNPRRFTLFLINNMERPVGETLVNNYYNVLV